MVRVRLTSYVSGVGRSISPRALQVIVDFSGDFDRAGGALALHEPGRSDELEVLPPANPSESRLIL